MINDGLALHRKMRKLKLCSLATVTYFLCQTMVTYTV